MNKNESLTEIPNNNTSRIQIKIITDKVKIIKVRSTAALWRESLILVQKKLAYPLA